MGQQQNEAAIQHDDRITWPDPHTLAWFTDIERLCSAGIQQALPAAAMRCLRRSKQNPFGGGVGKQAEFRFAPARMDVTANGPFLVPVWLVALRIEPANFIGLVKALDGEYWQPLSEGNQRPYKAQKSCIFFCQ